VSGWKLNEMPILAQYLFFLTMNVLAIVAQHGIIRSLVRTVLPRIAPHRSNETSEHLLSTTNPTSSSSISTALLVSSCTKLFPLLLLIWPTEAKESDSFGFAFRATNYVGWAVLLNNIEALLILLDCGYVIATGLAVSGFVARWVVETWFLSFVGLSSDTGPIGDMLRYVPGVTTGVT
jgi:lipid intermediate transporter